MKIAMVAPPWVPVPPPKWGGIELMIDALARGLTTAGHEVVLFALEESTCPVEVRTPYRAISGYGVGPVTMEMGWVLHAYEDLAEFDVIHDHTVVGPLYASRGDLPVVTTCHWPFQDELLDNYRLLSRSVPLIAISHAQKTAADFPIARVIHHGIDLQSLRVGDGGGGYFVYMGRMAPEKGPHVAARAARAAGVELRIAAKMHEEAEIRFFEQHVKPLLGDGVQYVGEVSGYEKSTFLGDAVAMLNPIGWPEPFGLAMVEAMACGTPVVTYPIGAATEIVTDNVTGFLCRDESELVAATASVSKLDRLACRRDVEERFSMASMAQAHIDLYADIAAGSFGSDPVRRRRGSMNAAARDV